MKFNLTAKKLNEVDVNVTFELTPDEMISVLKQGSEDFKSLMLYRDEIQELFKGLVDIYTETLDKVEKQRIVQQDNLINLNKIKTAISEDNFSDRYWYDVNGERKLKRSFEE